MLNKTSMGLYRPIGHTHILNLIQINLNFARKCAQKNRYSHIIMALNEDQGHSNWYQTVQFGGVYHYIMFEMNRFVNARMQPNVKVFFLQNNLGWIV